MNIQRKQLKTVIQASHYVVPCAVSDTDFLGCRTRVCDILSLPNLDKKRKEKTQGFKCDEDKLLVFHLRGAIALLTCILINTKNISSMK